MLDVDDPKDVTNVLARGGSVSAEIDTGQGTATAAVAPTDTGGAVIDVQPAHGPAMRERFPSLSEASRRFLWWSKTVLS
jgi:hypothetical protein